MSAPTLNEVLTQLGMTTKYAAGVTGSLGSKHVLQDGETLFTGKAGEVWDWLRSQGYCTCWGSNSNGHTDSDCPQAAEGAAS